MKITDPNKTLEIAGISLFIIDWEAGIVYLDNIQKLAEHCGAEWSNMAEEVEWCGWTWRNLK